MFYYWDHSFRTLSSVLVYNRLSQISSFFYSYRKTIALPPFLSVTTVGRTGLRRYLAFSRNSTCWLLLGRGSAKIGFVTWINTSDAHCQVEAGDSAKIWYVTWINISSEHLRIEVFYRMHWERSASQIFTHGLLHCIERVEKQIYPAYEMAMSVRWSVCVKNVV